MCNAQQALLSVFQNFTGCIILWNAYPVNTDFGIQEKYGAIGATHGILPKDAAEMSNHSARLLGLPLIYHGLHLMPASRVEFICYCPKPVTFWTAF